MRQQFCLYSNLCACVLFGQDIYVCTCVRSFVHSVCAWRAVIPSVLSKPTIITLLTSLFTLGLSVLSLAATTMVQLEKFVPVRGATSHGAHEGRSRGDTFALSSAADPDPAASYEPPSYYTRLHPSHDGDVALDPDNHVRACP
jgi:hypothetical protein